MREACCGEKGKRGKHIHNFTHAKNGCFLLLAAVLKLGINGGCVSGRPVAVKKEREGNTVTTSRMRKMIVFSSSLLSSNSA